MDLPSLTILGTDLIYWGTNFYFHDSNNTPNDFCQFKDREVKLRKGELFPFVQDMQHYKGFSLK